MTEPQEEYGWQMIRTPGEKAKAAPKQEFDELFCSNGTWGSVQDDGRFDSSPTTVYRRRIIPLDDSDWELVPWNSHFELGMELLIRGSDNWIRIGDQGVAWLTRMAAFDQHVIAAIRRPKAKAQAKPLQPDSPWILLSERKPTLADSDFREEVLFVHRTRGAAVNKWNADSVTEYTHWQPTNLPCQSEKPEWEKAFEAEYPGNSWPKELARGIWKAAWLKAKGQS